MVDPTPNGERQEQGLGALLPCPFCGTEARLCEGSSMWWVECADSGCDGQQCHDTKEQVIVAWNTRSTPSTKSNDRGAGS